MVNVEIIEAYEEEGMIHELDDGEIDVAEFQFLPRTGDELIPTDKNACEVLKVRHFSKADGFPAHTKVLVKRI